MGLEANVFVPKAGNHLEITDYNNKNKENKKNNNNNTYTLNMVTDDNNRTIKYPYPP